MYRMIVFTVQRAIVPVLEVPELYDEKNVCQEAMLAV